MEPIQFRMAQAALQLSVQQVAADLGISTATVNRFRNGGDSRRSTVAALRDYMTERGVKFIERDGKPGVLVGPLPGN